MSRQAQALDLGKRLSAGAEKFATKDEFHEAKDEYGGVDAPERDDGREVRAWDPKERCEAPRCAKLSSEFTDWEDARDDLDWSDTIILGAGESALMLDWHETDGMPVYAINWALKWFEPTALHAHDNQVVHSQIATNPAFLNRKSTVQVVTQAGNMPEVERAGGKALTYRTGDIHSPDPFRLFRFAEKPGEEFEYVPNSLSWALNAVYLLGAKRIFLAGFDWGGYHYTGDGRLIGSNCAYGADGFGPKKHLPAQLSAMGYQLLRRGVSVTLIGPTKLRGVFPRASSFAEVLRG